MKEEGLVREREGIKVDSGGRLTAHRYIVLRVARTFNEHGE